jgi:hypothetical protein
MSSTPNGLELINVGSFISDPSADTVTAAAGKVNGNMDQIDAALTVVVSLENTQTTLTNRGLVAGVIYGGSF